MENRCVMCGAAIPEGVMVCPACENHLDESPDDCEECMIHLEKE